jgi:hypothetical protein
MDLPKREDASQGEKIMLSQTRRQISYLFYAKMLILPVGGGVVFWGTTIATSLLPIAAEYRAAFSNWNIRTVWIASLPVGMLVGCCVCSALLRLFEKVPTRDPITKSMVLSFAALLIATILIDVPRSFLVPGQSDALYYFLIGILFNAARFLFLGLMIGYLYKRLYVSTRT